MKKPFTILIVMLFSTMVITTSGGALADGDTIELKCKGVKTQTTSSRTQRKWVIGAPTEAYTRLFINLELGMIQHRDAGHTPSLPLTKDIGMRITSGGKGDGSQGRRIIAQSVDPINFGCCAKSLILANKNNLHSNQPMEAVVTHVLGGSYVDDWDQEKQTIDLLTFRLICKRTH